MLYSWATKPLPLPGMSRAVLGFRTRSLRESREPAAAAAAAHSRPEAERSSLQSCAAGIGTRAALISIFHISAGLIINLPVSEKPRGLKLGSVLGGSGLEHSQRCSGMGALPQPHGLGPRIVVRREEQGKPPSCVFHSFRLPRGLGEIADSLRPGPLPQSEKDSRVFQVGLLGALDERKCYF